MKCQPIAPNSVISFNLIRKKSQNPEQPNNENTGFRLTCCGDSFCFTTLPPKDGILKDGNDR